MEIASNAASDHILAKDVTGAVFAWGQGSNGQQSNGIAAANYASNTKNQAVAVSGVSGDGELNRASAGGACQSIVGANNIISIPCLSLGTANYAVSLQYDLSINTGGGMFFKLMTVTPK